MGYSEFERSVIDGWPLVTDEDIRNLHDMFQHYLFYLKRRDGVEVWTSCCGHHEDFGCRDQVVTPLHWEFYYDLSHKKTWECPWCGEKVTAINTKMKHSGLGSTHHVVLLRERDGYLYADALSVWRGYECSHDYCAATKYNRSSGYRFSQGEVIQLDYQCGYRGKPVFFSERDKLCSRKYVREPFKQGSISWYHMEPYHIIGRDVLESHPFFKYSGFFHQWQYRPGGARGYRTLHRDFISYLTAYAIYPKHIEMMCKAGWFEPISDLIYQRKKHSDVMCWEAPDIKSALGMNKLEVKGFLEGCRDLDLLAIQKYVKRHWNRDWNFATCADWKQLWGMGGEWRKVLQLLKKYRVPIGRFNTYMDEAFGQSENDLYYWDLFDFIGTIWAWPTPRGGA